MSIIERIIKKCEEKNIIVFSIRLVSFPISKYKTDDSVSLCSEYIVNDEYRFVIEVGKRTTCKMIKDDTIKEELEKPINDYKKRLEEKDKAIFIFNNTNDKILTFLDENIKELEEGLERAIKNGKSTKKVALQLGRTNIIKKGIVDIMRKNYNKMNS